MAPLESRMLMFSAIEENCCRLQRSLLHCFATARMNAQNLTLEGQTGGFITPTAYVVITAKDHVWSHPAVGYHFVNASSVIGLRSHLLN